MNATVWLKSGRERAMLRRHPWVFSGAVARVEGDPAPGDTVRVLDGRGGFLAWAAYSPASQIRARVWAWDEAAQIDADFLRARLQQALALRHDLFAPGETDAQRLVYAESDGLPGLIVDRYGPALSVQFLSAGAERWRATLVELLHELTGAAYIYERSDAEVRRLEGLETRVGPLVGPPPGRVVIHEDERRYQVDIVGGHKTGFYLDQRRNRTVVQGLARGRRVLDCFCYTGGFSVAAALGGAAATLALDSSADALALGRENAALNGLGADQITWLQGDVFETLRTLRDGGHTFDLIVLDPPKFAPTAAQAERAARGYKDINLLALKLLAPGGLLVTFSCSGGVSADLFQKIVAGAALDAEVDAQIVAHLEQDRDHPVGLNYPEGAYLKGLVVRVG